MVSEKKDTLKWKESDLSPDRLLLVSLDIPA